ncbi:MAG: hypothetical protein V3W41_17170 [Planctomycetota bacterium]
MSHPVKIAIFFTTLALFLLPHSGWAQSARAKVAYRNSSGTERSERGDVLSHSCRGLVMKRRGGQKTIAEDDLISVTYSKLPNGYVAAMELFQTGGYYEAIDALLEILPEVEKKKSLSWAKQEIYFHASEAAYRVGDYAAAAEYAKTLSSKIADTRYRPQLELRSAGDLLAAGKYKEALAAYGKTSSGGPKKYSASFVLAGAVGKVRTHLHAGNLESAMSAVKAAEALVKKPEGKDLVAAWKARTLVAQKKFADAANQLSALLLKASANKRYQRQPALLAVAANGLGDIAFQKQDFEKAALEYSKTFALFGDLADLRHDVGWATWQFSLCCKRIATSTKEDDKRKVYTGRHRRMRERAAEDFQMTRGGQLARKELGMN